MKFVLCLFLLSIACVIGQNIPDDPMDERGVANEQCLRCICHARTGCFRMRNCANYSVSKDYWTTAGRPVVLDDDPDDDASYQSCIKDDGCILRTLRGYINTMTDRDCNCDGEINCKDYAAIHITQGQCQKSIDRRMLARLDTCLTDRKVPNSLGWNMGCSIPPAQ